MNRSKKKPLPKEELAKTASGKYIAFNGEHKRMNFNGKCGITRGPEIEKIVQKCLNNNLDTSQRSELENKLREKLWKGRSYKVEVIYVPGTGGNIVSVDAITGS